MCNLTGPHEGASTAPTLMKILIVGLNFWPELVGVGKYTGEMAASFAEAGHEVRVVAGPPYYPRWQREQGWSRFRYHRERMDCLASNAATGTSRTIEVWRCPIYVPKRPTGFRRILHLFTFAASSLPAVLCQIAWRPRVVIAIAPTLLSAPAALAAGRAAAAAAWLHVQDFEVDAAYELGLLRTGFLRGIVNVCEGWLMRRFDKVSTISAAMQQRLAKKGVVLERTLLLRNWVDTAEVHPLLEPSIFRQRLGIGAGRVVALYSGAMASKQGLELIIESAQSLTAEPIDFVLCGDGPARAQLQAAAAGFANIRFLPLQPVSLLNQLLNLADIHLLPQRPGIADLVMPSKLAGMIASGRPVVATASANSQISLALEGCGRVVAPGDRNAFAGAISELARDARLRLQLGATGRAKAESEWSRSRILGEFVHQLEGFAKS